MLNHSQIKCGNGPGVHPWTNIISVFCFPLFDLAKMTKFADDNFIIKCNKFQPQLIIDMKQTLEMIIKRLRDSGLKGNDIIN